MPEYIEREAIEYPYMTMSMWGINSATCKAYNEGVKAVEDYIASIPAVDVVEVVRCKDCEHRYVPCHCALWYATANGTEYFIERGDDFSCSYGKRKEGADNGNGCL